MPAATPARARRGLRAASAAGRRRPPRGGRCRRRGRTNGLASRCRSARAPRSDRRVRPQPRTVAPQASEASSVTSGIPASACETGQPSFAAFAASLKAASSDSGHRGPNGQHALRDALAWLERDRRGRLQLLGRVPTLREAARQGHREADWPTPRRSAPRGSSSRSAPRRAPPTRRRVGPNAPLGASAIVPLPLIRSPCHTTFALRCVAIRPSPPHVCLPAEPSLELEHFPQRPIDTSSWSSVGSRVVRRCSQRPGASSVISTRLSECRPAKRISSYAIPAITGRRRCG